LHEYEPTDIETDCDLNLDTELTGVDDDVDEVDESDDIEDVEGTEGEIDCAYLLADEC
jgi:hypothetical protein